MNESMEKYFTDKILQPLAEREKEATTNKAFYMGDKQFEYVVTLTGHESVVGLEK